MQTLYARDIKVQTQFTSKSTVTKKAHAHARKGRFPIYRQLESVTHQTRGTIQERQLIACFVLDSEFYIGMLVVEVV